jgi:hypothetical protein
MKTITILIIVFSLLIPQVSFSDTHKKHRKHRRHKKNTDSYTCKRPQQKISAEIIKLCHNVDDINCIDIKKEDRRSCEEADHTFYNYDGIVNKCFHSSIEGMGKFVTELIPELAKSMWSILKSSDEKSEKSWWEKAKGMYESTSALYADLYEGFIRNPHQFISNIFEKIYDFIKLNYVQFDCLKPELKIDHFCSTAGEFFFPPILLAGVLIKSIKTIKSVKKVAGLTLEAKLAEDAFQLKLKIDALISKVVLTVAEYHAVLNQYRALGYTEEEFDFLYRMGRLKQIPFSDLSKTATQFGLEQKAELLEGFVTAFKVPSKTAVVSEAVYLAKYNDKFLRVLEKQKKIAGDIQKMGEQAANDLKTAEGAKRTKLIAEIEDTLEGELKIRKDILETAKKLNKTDEIAKTEERIKEINHTLETMVAKN